MRGWVCSFERAANDRTWLSNSDAQAAAAGKPANAMPTEIAYDLNKEAL